MHEVKEKRLVFDFDGVLVNSHTESMITAYNAATDSLEMAEATLPRSFVSAFSNNRSHVRNAGEMTCLAKWCVENAATGAELISRKGVEALLPDSDTLHTIAEGFFSKRQEFYLAQTQESLQLTQPYQPVWNYLQSHPKDVCIVTHKNKSAVLELLNFHQLLITGDRIYTGDSGLSKTENFEQLFTDCPAEQYIFIDDNVWNLLELKTDFGAESKVELLFAEWGYGSASDADEARSNGIGVHTQDSLIEYLKKIAE